MQRQASPLVLTISLVSAAVGLFPLARGLGQDLYSIAEGPRTVEPRGVESPPPKDLGPGEPVDGADIAFYPERWRRRDQSLELVPWRGKEVAFLTTKADLDPRIVARFVERLDGGWKLYANLTGRSPGLLKQLDGKPTVVAVPDAALTCGIGCGYMGSTGIEVGGFYEGDYPLVSARRDDFPHYYFYEMGRNYYTFGDRHSQFSCGFAVFMRYVCMDALRCGDPDLATRRTIEEAEARFAESDMGFLKGFTLLGGLSEKEPRLRGKDGSWIQPSDQPVLYASAMLKLRSECGGDEWLKRFFAELTKCPEITARSPADALRQSLSWMVSGSSAARKDLSPIFAGRWRLPLAPKARDILAKVDWGSPKVDVREILGKLPEPDPKGFELTPPGP